MQPQRGGIGLPYAYLAIPDNITASPLGGVAVTVVLQGAIVTATADKVKPPQSERLSCSGILRPDRHGEAAAKIIGVFV